MKRLVVRGAAERDAEAARDWYQAEAELGEDFITELRNSLERLRYLSDRFPEVRRGVRRSLMDRFPYAIYFAVHDAEVIVLAVLHLRRAPSVLDRRLADEDAV